MRKLLSSHKFNINVSAVALGFLVWFRNQYNRTCSESYTKIAKRCPFFQSSGTASKYILELEAAGYLNIWNKGSREQVIRIMPVAYNTLVYPIILKKRSINNSKGAENTEENQG